MARAPEESGSKKNVTLSGWLDRLDKALEGLQGFADYNGEPPRFRGDIVQWFQAKQGTSISVTPHRGIGLAGGRYAAHQEGMREPLPSDPYYTEQEPFTGGLAIRACLKTEFLEHGVTAELICVREGIGNEPAMFSKGRPNLNFSADAIAIPNGLRPHVAIAIMDGAAQPIG